MSNDGANGHLWNQRELVVKTSLKLLLVNAGNIISQFYCVEPSPVANLHKGQFFNLPKRRRATSDKFM